MRKFKQKTKDKLCEETVLNLGRPLEPHEMINLESDALALARLAMERIEDLEDEIELLKKKKR